MLRKRGLALPFTIIIVVAILLVVLVVILGIFTKKVPQITARFEHCPGACLPSCDEEYPIQAFKGCIDAQGNPHKDWYCCLKA